MNQGKRLDKRRVQAHLPATGGTYVLIFRSESESSVRIGRLGILNVRPGYYLYVGSAFGSGGLSARVGRHALRRKTLRWHIDYLAKQLSLVGIFYSQDHERHEREWAYLINQIESVVVPMAGFGASDIPGESHLFFSTQKPGRAFFSSLPGKHREYLI